MVAALPDASAPIDASASIDAGVPADAAEMFSVDQLAGAASFEARAREPDMEALARRIFPDAKLVSMVGQGLRPDGTYDLSGATSGSVVKYVFRSPAASVETGLHAPTRTCLVWVTAHDGGADVTDTWSYDCAEPFLDLRCDGAQMLARARAQGAPRDWLVTVMQKGGRWELWYGDQYFYVRDADCAR